MEVRGHRVHVDVHGAGTPVICVHSSGMSGRQWQRVVRELPDHRVVVPDLLGSGRSDRWTGPGPEAMAADRELLAALLDEVGPAHLVGHSYGGTLCLLEAARTPARALSVAVFEPPVVGPLGRDLDPGPLGEGPDVWMAWLVDWWNGEGTWASLGDATRREMLRGAEKVSWEVRGQLADRTLASAFAALEGPTLLLRGPDTPPVVAEALDVVAAALPNGALEVIAGVGHMGPLTHPGRVVPRLLSLIRR